MVQTIIKYIKSNRLIVALGLLSLIIQLSFFLFNHVEYISINWILDDSFYYFQPAWNFVHSGVFTFDGINETYGFQPLWMIIITVLASLSADKLIFVKSILVFSTLLYFLCGLLIYNLTSTFINNRFKYLPSVIWFFNSSLVLIFVSGKENLLAVMLLLIILLKLNRQSAYDLKNFIVFGLLFSLLILTRINSILFFIIFSYFIIKNSDVENKLYKVSLFVITAIIVSLPWIIYSYISFGTVFPSSGTVKTYGILSSLLLVINNVIPISDSQWIQNLLPPLDKKLFNSGIAIASPDLKSLSKYLLQLLFPKVLALGLYQFVRDNFHSLKKQFEIGYAVVFVLILSVFVGLIKGKFRIFIQTIRQNINKPIRILFIYASLNVIINFLFMSNWILYCDWYAFPEILSVLFGFTIFIVSFYSVIHLRLRENVKSFITILFILFVITNFGFQIYQPKNVARTTFANEVWNAKGWIEKNLEPHQRIGSWSSGLLGFYLDKYSVVNLDGLINSPEFVEKVIPDKILIQNQLSDKDVLWEYVKKNNIKFLAEPLFVNQKNNLLLHEMMPEADYRIIYEGKELIDWDEPEGLRKYFVIQLIY